MQRRVYGVAVTITGAIFTLILSVYPDLVRKFISKSLDIPDETIVILFLILIAIIWVLTGIFLLVVSPKPKKATRNVFDTKLSHVNAQLFYPPMRKWHRIRVLEKHWWEIWKQTPSRNKLILVRDLKKAYWVGEYGWNLVTGNKIEWFSQDNQELEQWCKKEGYTLIRAEADEGKILEPYFESEIIVKKSEYMQGEAVFFRTYYRGKLTNGFFDNQITPLSGSMLPNRRPSYWSWSPDTLPNPMGGGKLSGYVNHTSSWDWSIPRDAPTGKYMVIMGVHNHFDIQNRPRVAHKEETITVVSRFGEGAEHFEQDNENLGTRKKKVPEIRKEVYDFAHDTMGIDKSDAQKFALNWKKKYSSKSFGIFKETYSFARNIIGIDWIMSRDFALEWVEKRSDKDFAIYTEKYLSLRKSGKNWTEAKETALNYIDNGNNVN